MARRVWMVATACAMLGVAAPRPAIAQEQPTAAVEWQVKDRFRLFDRAHPDARQEVQQLADSIRGNPSENFVDYYDEFLVTLSGLNGSRTHSASLRRSNYQPAPSEGPRTSGRYAPDYLYPQHYSIELRVPAATPDATCVYRSQFAQQSGPCGEWTPLIVADGARVSRADWTVRARVEVEIPRQAATTIDISFQDQLVVALGDSYISGEGNPDVPSVITERADDVFERSSWGSRIRPNAHVLREAEWWDEPCHRSLLSWPVLASFVHSARNPKHAVTLVHLGCSGAVAPDIYLHGETELPGGGDERESQLALLDSLMARPDESWQRRKIDRALLSIGGNDAGFVGVIATLALPPNGFLLGGLAASVIGDQAGAVCPYDTTGTPLLLLCNDRVSAQSRLSQLDRQYMLLEQALDRAGSPANRVYQPLYPNSLLTKVEIAGEQVLAACDTNPDNGPYDGRLQPDEHLVEASGFESIMGVLPRIARGFLYRSWNFEFMYLPEQDVDASQPLLWSPGARCDAVPEGTESRYEDSEVCQALWVHNELNRLVTENRFNEVTGHMSAIAGHGLCRQTAAFPLAMPLVRDHQWVGRTPQTVNPYDRANPRWFRTPNDSVVTQFSFYGDEPRFNHGTVHPTFRSHVEIAQAVYGRALEGTLPAQQ